MASRRSSLNSTAISEPSHENGYPTAPSPVHETLAVQTDSVHEPERDYAQAVRAVGRVLGKAEELEHGQRNSRAVAGEDTDEAADQARYGGEERLQQSRGVCPFREPEAFYPCSESGRHGGPFYNRFRVASAITR